MEAPLHGPPQFIVTSITFLITSNQAAYLNRLDQLFHSKHGAITVRELSTWKCLLLAWWVLTFSALLGAIRILVFAWSSLASPVESTVFDGVILSVMTVGYVLLAYVALRSWKCTKWGEYNYTQKAKN
jgi:hypothetical protein